MVAFSFPVIDKTRFVWHASADDPLYYKREGWGCEVTNDFLNRYQHGEQNLFLATDITLFTPAPLAKLVEVAREAWVALRFDTPIIAAHTEQDEKDHTLITYRAAENIQIAREWADRTVRVVDGEDLEELRYKIGQRPIPESTGDQTFLYLSARSDTFCNVILYTSHVPFDGACTKIVVTRFLKKFANYLNDPSRIHNDTLEWGTEMKNLAPAAVEIIGPNEIQDGPQYTRTLGNILGDYMDAMPRKHGFRMRNIGLGYTRRVFRRFSDEQTSALLRFTRANGFTIGQITHAALMMVCAYDNPPAPGTDALFLSHGLVDCRPRLAPEYTGRDAYSGYSLGISPIVVPVSIYTAASADGEKVQLLKMTVAVKAEYKKQAAYPSLLAVIGQQTDFMLAPSRAGVRNPPWMGPWYAGDGPGEKYLDCTYTCASGDEVLRIDRFFTSLNKIDPGPFFRTHSWGHRLELGADFNENAMPREVVEVWLDKWFDLLSLVI